MRADIILQEDGVAHNLPANARFPASGRPPAIIVRIPTPTGEKRPYL